MAQKTRKMFFPLMLPLIFQVFLIYAFPADFHIRLCIGSDGHIDFSQDFCQSFTKAQVESSLTDNTLFHHGDCRDIEIECISECRKQLSTGFNSSKDKSIPSFRMNAYSILEAPQKDLVSFRHPNKSLPLNTVSLCSVVLLI